MGQTLAAKDQWYVVHVLSGQENKVRENILKRVKTEEMGDMVYDVLLLKEREEKVKPKVSFEVGESVKVADGPFQNQTGVVEEIDPERGKLRVSVTIFGRATPVELEYWQVERG